MKNQSDPKMKFVKTSLAGFKSASDAQAILSNCNIKLVMQKSDTESQENSPGKDKY